ncbi:MAG: MXAN_5187 family protein [Polyangiaceae bacterium]
MLASRFWYVVMGIALGFFMFLSYVSAAVFDRESRRVMTESLSGDSQVVGWYLKDDARRRSSALINFALDDDLVKSLAKASSGGFHEKIPDDAKKKAHDVLKKVNDKLGADTFTSLFAVDQHGRVIAQVGFQEAAGIDDFELGGYSAVADALHGWIRDDAWVLNGRIYRVVARPVEGDTSQPPAGAIVGTRILDDAFAREMSKRTGAAIAFFAAGSRVASDAPETFDKGRLDAIVGDLDTVVKDENFQKKGRSEVRVLQGNIGVMYGRIQGEAWDLNAGFAVAREAALVGSPYGFLKKADDNDKKAAQMPLIGGAVLGLVLIGLLFTYLEFSRPMGTFEKEAERMAKGEADQLTPSKFRGAFRKVATVINDGFEKVIEKGGGARKAANLEQVLGPMPAQPVMSAFSFPGDAGAPPVVPDTADPFQIPPPPGAEPAAPKPPPPRHAPPAAANGDVITPPPAPKKNARPVFDEEPEATVVSKVPEDLIQRSATGEFAAPADGGEMADWNKVFEDFVALKKQNGEPTEGLTFEKFQNTLRKNRDALVAKHGCKRVKFTVYTKEGKAALKASPVND